MITDGMRYESEHVIIDIGENQGRCSEWTCTNEALRQTGCTSCVGGVCIRCADKHIRYDGRCVECLTIEDCVFNNSGEIYCIDGDDLSHCAGENASGCSEHVCLYGGCGNGVVEEGEECEIGGTGCRGCACMSGWYSNHTNDCYSECWDGNLTNDE